MSQRHSFVDPPSGRGTVGCVGVILVPPVLGSAWVLGQELGPALVVLPLVVGAVLLALAYYVHNVETALELDERTLRFSRARVVFGARLRTTVVWEMPASALVRAHEARTRTPSSRGGWERRTVLQLPSGRTISAVELGGADDPASAYNRFVRFLEERLGDAFTRTDDAT